MNEKRKFEFGHKNRQLKKMINTFLNTLISSASNLCSLLRIKGHGVNNKLEKM
jgi:hypothetical protein